MEAAAEALVAANLDLAKIHAARIFPRFSTRLELEDLYQAGVEGLMAAAKRYDPDRGVRFRTFASQRVHGAIIDETRRTLEAHVEVDPENSTQWNQRRVYPNVWIELIDHKHDRLGQGPTLEDSVVDRLYSSQLLRGIRAAAAGWPRSERSTLEWILTGEDRAVDFARREGVTDSAISQRRRKVEAKLRVLIPRLMAA